MNEANFVSRVQSFITGDFFLAEKDIPLHAFRDSATGLTLGPDGGTAAQAVTPTMIADGLSFDDGETALLQFMVPQDFAVDSGKMALRFNVTPSAASSDTTDIGITSAQVIFRPGSAEDATASTAVAEAATASTGRLTREVILDISDRSFQPGDVIQLTVDANNSGTTELVLAGAALIYGSTLRAYNDDDNDRNIGS